MTGVPYRSDIQGLRAIAVIAVIIFHFNPTWLPGGYIGVDVFLVISGFLITNILLSKKFNANYTLIATLKYFYTGRFKRIAPAYFSMLLLVGVVAAILLLPNDFHTFEEGLMEAVWFNSNSYFADFGDYFAPSSHEQPLLHTWSLAVEIQFYLLAPLMVLILPVRILSWLLIVLVVCFTLAAEYRLRFLGVEQATYYSLYARLPEFFVGCLAAIYVTSTSERKVAKAQTMLNNLGILLVLLSTFIQPIFGQFPGLSALIPTSGTVLLLVTQGFTARILSTKLLVWIGALSYSLYLWHWPVLAFLRYFSGSENLSLQFSVLFLGITFLLSLASYYWIERQFQRNGSSKYRVLGWALLPLLLLTNSQVLAKVSEVFSPEQLPIEYRRYADRSLICHSRIVGECLFGDLKSEKELLVLGDSHAAMMNNFFDYLGKDLGFKARIITASSCVTIPEFDYLRIVERSHESCLKQIEEADKYIQSAKIVILAASWNWHLSSTKFRNSLQNFIRNSTLNETKVYIIGQEPLLKINPLRIIRFNNLGLEIESQIDHDYLRTNEILMEMAEGLSLVQYIDLGGLPIFENVPFYEGELIYYDNHHINEIGATIYAKQAKPIIETQITNDK